MQCSANGATSAALAAGRVLAAFSVWARHSKASKAAHRFPRPAGAAEKSPGRSMRVALTETGPTMTSTPVAAFFVVLQAAYKGDI